MKMRIALMLAMAVGAMTFVGCKEEKTVDQLNAQLTEAQANLAKASEADKAKIQAQIDEINAQIKAAAEKAKKDVEKKAGEASEKAADAVNALTK